MTIRTTRKLVTFAKPFTLGKFDEILPPGSYAVETDEELLEGLSFVAYRRTLTVFILPAVSGSHPGVSRALSIDPNDLETALMRDHEPEINPARRSPGQEARINVARMPQDKWDCLAIDRAINEGMIHHRR